MCVRAVVICLISLLAFVGCGGSSGSDSESEGTGSSGSSSSSSSSGSTTTTCVEDEQRCASNGGAVEQCVGNQWRALSSCAANQSCVESEGTPACTAQPVACTEVSDCDDQQACTLDFCGENGQCSNTVIEACETLEYAWDIPLNLKMVEDFESVVYIDPDYTGGDSDGSLEKPYTSWGPLKSRLQNELVESPSHTAYVQKRGTSTNFDAGYGFIAVHGDHILLGAYGDSNLPPPIIYDANIHLEGSHIVMRDLDIIGTSSSSYSKAITLHGYYNTLYNNKIHGENDVDRFLGYCITGNSFGAKIVNNEIYNCHQDAIYGAGRYIEIGHNKIYNIDITGKGPADIIQFIYSTCEGYWIHHNDFDGREIDNKFAVINTDCDDAGNSYGVVEHNLMVMSNRPMFHVAGRMILRNNRFVQDSDRNPAENGFEPVLWSYLTHLEAYNNTFTNTKLASSTPSNLILTNNTFIYPQDETVAIDTDSNSIYSSSFNVGDASASITDVFVNFPDNLRLTTNSPARAAGSAEVFSSLSEKYKVGESLVDLDGKSMPGDVVDAGAYQSSTP